MTDAKGLKCAALFIKAPRWVSSRGIRPLLNWCSILVSASLSVSAGRHDLLLSSASLSYRRTRSAPPPRYMVPPPPSWASSSIPITLIWRVRGTHKWFRNHRTGMPGTSTARSSRAKRRSQGSHSKTFPITIAICPSDILAVSKTATLCLPLKRQLRCSIACRPHCLRSIRSL